MRSREKDQVKFNKLVDRIKIPQYHCAPLVIDKPGIVDHWKLEKVNAKRWVCNFILSFRNTGEDFEPNLDGRIEGILFLDGQVDEMLDRHDFRPGDYRIQKRHN